MYYACGKRVLMQKKKTQKILKVHFSSLLIIEDAGKDLQNRKASEELLLFPTYSHCKSYSLSLFFYQMCSVWGSSCGDRSSQPNYSNSTLSSGVGLTVDWLFLHDGMEHPPLLFSSQLAFRHMSTSPHLRQLSHLYTCIILSLSTKWPLSKHYVLPPTFSILHLMYYRFIYV